MLTRMGRGFLYFDNELKSNVRLNRNNNKEHLAKKKGELKKNLIFLSVFSSDEVKCCTFTLGAEEKTLYSFLVFRFGSYKRSFVKSCCTEDPDPPNKGTPDVLFLLPSANILVCNLE